MHAVFLPIAHCSSHWTIQSTSAAPSASSQAPKAKKSKEKQGGAGGGKKRKVPAGAKGKGTPKPAKKAKTSGAVEGGVAAGKQMIHTYTVANSGVWSAHGRATNPGLVTCMCVQLYITQLRARRGYTLP